MIRFVYICNGAGAVKFSHYFEAVPSQLRFSMEKDIVEECLISGGREGSIQRSDCLVAFRREGVLIIIAGAMLSTSVTIIKDLLHTLAHILVHHLKNTTEMQTFHNTEIIHKVLEQMVHGNMLETRISHITVLRDIQMQDVPNKDV